MDKQKTQKYSHLCDLVGQLSELIEPDFMREVTQLETDIAGMRLDTRRLKRERSARAKAAALATVLGEVEKMLGKIHLAKAIPSMKGTLALLEAWPEDDPVVRRASFVVKRAMLIADKAKVRTSLMSMLEHCCEPVRDEIS